MVETFIYTITDGDGDTATATFTVTLTDTGVTNVTTSNNLLADEDDIPTIGNNNAASGDDAAGADRDDQLHAGRRRAGLDRAVGCGTGLTKLDGVTAVSTAWDPAPTR